MDQSKWIIDVLDLMFRTRKEGGSQPYSQVKVQSIAPSLGERRDLIPNIDRGSIHGEQLSNKTCS